MPDVADARAQRPSRGPARSSPQRTSPLAGASKRREDAEQRALAGAVGPEHGGDAPRLELRAHVGERPPAAVDLADRPTGASRRPTRSCRALLVQRGEIAVDLLELA